MKARNIIIILVVQYVLLVVISSIIELYVLAEKAKEVQVTMRTAADMALQQSQLVDDFMTYNGRGSYYLTMPSSSGQGFIREDLFAGVYGLDSKVQANKETIFNRLYVENTLDPTAGNDLKLLSTRLDAMRKPVKYWSSPAHTDFSWYYIPRASMMGLDVLPRQYPEVGGVKDASGAYVSDSLAREIMSVYRLDSHTKMSNGQEYYNTPISSGITYLNQEMLGTLFMNNMDLLMRKKYTANLNSEAGGNGILKGSTFADKLKGDLSQFNPINNGSFSLLRGTQNASAQDVKSFTGVKPLITYKVIDMYDRTNDDMLVVLFGAEKGGMPYKADYLKSLDNNVINPVTGSPYDKKPIVVAKVTFYADVVIPYFSIIAREMRSSFGGGDSNFVEMQPEKATGSGGTRTMTYTRYFAVTP